MDLLRAKDHRNVRRVELPEARQHLVRGVRVEAEDVLRVVVLRQARGRGVIGICLREPREHDVRSFALGRRGGEQEETPRPDLHAPGRFVMIQGDLGARPGTKPRGSARVGQGWRITT